MRERGKLEVTGLKGTEGDSPPQLLVVIHTEEEFDWSAPFDRSATATSHIPAIQPIHEDLVCKGAKPTYVVDFPVASQEESVQLIRQLLMDRGTTIGAHLHPWVSPPHEEEVSTYNSYPGNLPESLERAKITMLSNKIEESFGIRPTVYLAGRYGYGPNTGRILKELGYEIDMSAAPCLIFRLMGAPITLVTIVARSGRLIEITSYSPYIGPGRLFVPRRHFPLPYRGPFDLGVHSCSKSSCTHWWCSATAVITRRLFAARYVPAHESFVSKWCARLLAFLPLSLAGSRAYTLRPQ